MCRRESNPHRTACSVCCYIIATTSPDCITVLFRLYGGEIASGLRRWLAGKTINYQLLTKIKKGNATAVASIITNEILQREQGSNLRPSCVVHVALPPCSPAYSSRRRSPMGQCLFHTLRRCRSVSGYQAGHFPCRCKTTYLAVGRVMAVWLAALLPKQLDILILFQ